MSEFSAHPGAEELAAFAAGDLDSVSDVRSHLLDCADCGADLAAIERATQALAALPELQMPLDVITALERSLADAASDLGAAPGDSPLPSLAAARKRKTDRFAPLAAAAAVVGLAVALGAGPLRNGSDNRGDSAGAPAADTAERTQAAAPRFLRSGTDYDGASLDGRVRDALSAPPDAPALSAEAPAPLAAEAGGSSAGAAQADSAKSAVGPTLTDDELQSCVDELSGQPGALPLLVDFASYSGAPAVVVVLPFREGQVDVYVVRPECRLGNDALIFFKRVRIAP